MGTDARSLLVSGATGWHDGSQTITYSFLTTTMPSYYSQVDTNFDGVADAWLVSAYNDPDFYLPMTSGFAMNGAERALAELAIAAWNEVANINLEPGTISGGFGDLVFGSGAFNSTGLYGFVADFPGVLGRPDHHGDLWVNTTNPDQIVNELGHTSWNTFLHELGHALGLHHPNEDPNNFAGDPTNNNQYTVMSYVPHPSEAGQFYYNQDWPLTPMIYDIQALQILYGA